jgi:hypothetical protein
MYSLQDGCDGWKGTVEIENDPQFTDLEVEAVKGFFHFIGDLITSIGQLPACPTRERLLGFITTGLLVFKENLNENLTDFMSKESWDLDGNEVEAILGAKLAEDLFAALKTDDERDSIAPLLPPYINAKYLKQIEEEFFDEEDDSDLNEE